jgi:hypothetical protein
MVLRGPLESCSISLHTSYRTSSSGHKQFIFIDLFSVENIQFCPSGVRCSCKRSAVKGNFNEASIMHVWGPNDSYILFGLIEISGG